MPFAPLDWTADPPGRSAAPELRALRCLVLAHLAVQASAWAIAPLPPPFTLPTALIGAVAALLLAATALSLSRHGRRACIAALPLALGLVVWIFPQTPNHTGLVVLMLALFALLDPERDDEAALLLQTLRWLAVLVFFWAGVQKLLHGLYFQGEFLAWMVGRGVDRWAQVFGWVLPADEIARLQAYPRYLIGAGPYRVAAPAFVLLSNSVWLLEIALGLGMLLRRTRALAALGAIGLTFAIQLAPREFMFALLYTQLLLLAVPGDWNRRLLPVFLLLYAWLVAALLGAPGEFLLKAGRTL